MSVQKLVSGGQTGADRAALDVALELGLATGGWIPRGRRAEAGRIPDRYPGLVESESTAYERRTELNVRDSDATVVFAFGPLEGGSALTARLAKARGKPLLVVDLENATRSDAAGALRAFLARHRPHVLNVAGQRSSKEPRIAAATAAVLREALRASSREAG